MGQQLPRTDVSIIVTPHCSLISALMLFEPLRAANRISKQSPFVLNFVSIDGLAVIASNGFVIPVTKSLDELSSTSVVCLVSSYDQPAELKIALYEKLRRYSRHGAVLCGIDHGVVMLAEAGLIRNRRISVHWEQLGAVQERWPELDVCEDLYCMDRGLLTCGGHTACLDMTLAFIADRYDPELAHAVANEMLTSGLRAPDTPQRSLSALEPWSENEALKQAVDFMHRNLEHPVAISEIARRVNVSKRQLEYLAQRFLKCSPINFYIQLRLQRARGLLLYTDFSISEIAAATGFSGIAVFSRSFHRHFGTSPTHYRRRFRTTHYRPYLS